MRPDIERPLAVDLDGTLTPCDLLVEGASAYVARRPWGVVNLLRWTAAGRDRLKVELARRSPFDAATLPLRGEVLDWLEEEHRAGRRLLLVSASDEHQVRAVAEHLDIFDGFHGTRLGRNLKSTAKRDLLVDEFGEGGYDYIGNHGDDRAVWAAAHTAHVVGSPKLAAEAGSLTTLGRTFKPTRPSTARLLLKAMRPHQWIKNLLVAVPLVTAQMLGDTSAVLRTLLAMALFSLVASSVYLLNDLIDIPSDRQHPAKRRRPFASGELSLIVGWVVWPILTVTAFGLALAFLPWDFTVVLAIYVAITLTYSLWAKRKAVLDVILLGGLYTVRMVAGGAAIDVPLTMWLITFSMLFFLSLALVKRVSELTRVRRDNEIASWERVPGRGYAAGDLELLTSYGVASSVGSVVILTLYLQDEHTRQLYASPELLGFAIPILLAWLMRCWLLAHRGQVNEDPLVFAARDPASILAGLAFGAAFVAANVLHV